MEEIVIVSAQRTPMGKFGGALSSVNAVALGQHAAQAAIQAAGIAPEQIDQAIFGNVLQANSGQNVARQIALGVGMRPESTAMTINEVCGSGLKAVRLGQSAIAMGDADIVLVGGTENMSQAPFYAPNMRFGKKLGDVAFVDGMMRDGLADAFTNEPMGITAENVATEYQVSRQDQDAFALASHQKAVAAMQRGDFDAEIAPLTVQSRRGQVVVRHDEGPRADTSAEKLAHLRPSFQANGTVTAGNASGINDGAAAMILMSRSKAQALGVDWLAKIAGFAEGGIAPRIMGYAPKAVVERLLQKTQTPLAAIDIFELNEAFAAQSVAVIRDLHLDSAKVNPLGGAIALGHPLGASGARLLVTLVHQLKHHQQRIGVAALCIGGGMSVAMQVEARG
ncbi:thiolase family protein [Lacticaseibacillus baoqingensis]|uniref:acetyl-CoA C-acetyltransferase n=1 Tax=Lacticaseibacillus baoqingensis TaxID=2486013 RepID=A0ABW4E144_9LACO|nr:acetyl-CoA C-acyltransferase [Lacticaseibacillus baoqingensis]